MLHINMNNIYCSYEPQSLKDSFAAVVMRQNGIVPLSCRIPGDGCVSV